MDEKQQQAFEGFAVVEQMGHNRYAGRISEFTIGGASLIRIEIPEIPEKTEEYWGWGAADDGVGMKRVKCQRTIPGRQAFTKFIGVQSVFSITPCTEEVARAAAEQMRAEPITCVQMPERLALPEGSDPEPEEEGADPLNGEPF